MKWIIDILEQDEHKRQRLVQMLPRDKYNLYFELANEAVTIIDGEKINNINAAILFMKNDNPFVRYHCRVILKYNKGLFDE